MHPVKSLYTHAHKCVGHADVEDYSLDEQMVAGLAGSLPVSVQMYKDLQFYFGISLMVEQQTLTL